MMEIIGKLELKKKDYLALLLISIYILAFFKPVPAGDGFKFYAVLEGGVRDHTLNLKEQARFNEVSGRMTTIDYDEATGRYFTIKSFGFPLLSAPLYSLSLFLDNFRIFHINDDFFMEQRRDILIHMASMSITTLIFVYITVLVSIFIIKKFYTKKWAATSVLIAFFSTPILKYATYDSSYSHGVEAGLMSIIVLLILKDYNPLIIGALIGLLTTVRYSSIIFLLPLCVYYLYLRRYEDINKAVAGAIPFLILIFFYWYLINGTPFSSGYPDKFHLFLVPQNLLNLIIHPDKSMLLWTPSMALAIIGLFLLKDNKKWIFLGIIGSYFIFHSGIPDWFGGDAFGLRYYVVLFPLFAIGISSILNYEGRLKYLFYVFALYTTFLSLLFYGYAGKGNPANFTHLFRFWITERNLPHLPSLLWQRVSIVRLILKK